MNNTSTFCYVRNYICAAMLIAAFACLSSCADDSCDDSEKPDLSLFGSVENIVDADGAWPITIFGTEKGAAALYFSLEEDAAEDMEIKFILDTKALNAYNSKHGTSYAMYPADNVSFANAGAVNIAAGSRESEPMEVTVLPNVQRAGNYAIAVSAEVTVGGTKVNKNIEGCVYVIKPQPARSDADKGTGVKAVCYIDADDESLLNAGEYTMEGSGKPFFDVLNIYTAYINFSKKTGKVYLDFDDDVEELLMRADELIRPLQAKGIKVCLSVAGNGDEAGVANLSAETASYFAQQLKMYLNTFGLDGVDFRDGNSLYNTQYGGLSQPPIEAYVPGDGFVNPKGGGGAARLLYECRQIMPDKIISFYDYKEAYMPNGYVEGVAVGEMLDYCYFGLCGNWSDRHGAITDLTEEKYCPISINLNFTESNGGYRMTDINEARTQGFGVQMFWDLKPARFDYNALLDDVGSVIFNDGASWTGKTYEKDSSVSTVNKPAYDAYLGNWLTTSESSFYYKSPYWYYGGAMETTLTIEEKVAGQSYVVSGWFLTNGELPLQANYNAENGRLEIPLPQKSTDTVTGEEWLYLPRFQYPYNSAYWMNYSTEFVGYSGIVKDGGICLYPAPQPDYKMARSMSAVQLNEAGTVIEKAKGTDINKDIIWHPLIMKK